MISRDLMAHKKHNRFDLRLHVLDTKIAQFRYIDNSAIIDLSTRLRGINSTNCVVIFQSLVLRSTVIGHSRNLSHPRSWARKIA